MPAILRHYSQSLVDSLECVSQAALSSLLFDLENARSQRSTVFLCGNGGSAANALHWANDLLYGAARGGRPGLRVHALPANAAICTCLANDEGYQEVFSSQLKVLASAGDLLIVFSGSGNSPNVLCAIEAAKLLGMRSWAIVGFDGGQALRMADCAIHFQIDDMQVAEDCQMVLGHVVTRMLAVHA